MYIWKKICTQGHGSGKEHIEQSLNHGRLIMLSLAAGLSSDPDLIQFLDTFHEIQNLKSFHITLFFFLFIFFLVLS